MQNLKGHEKSLSQKKNQFLNSLVRELCGDQIVLLPPPGALAGGCECVLTGFRCAVWQLGAPQGSQVAPSTEPCPTGRWGFWFRSFPGWPGFL